jgi:hypothetical protein
MSHPANFDDLTLRGNPAGREDGEWLWYPTLREYISSCTLLDVRVGVSPIKSRLAPWGTKVTTHDACPMVEADLHGGLEHIPKGAFQVVTCFDVIEHVKEYGRFAYEAARIAAERLIVATPGFAVTGCRNLCHWHEFLPDELYQLLSATGMDCERAFGASGDLFPAQTEPFREYPLDQIRANVRMHPICLVFHW